MSLQQTINFDNPNNFNLESGKIDFSQGKIWGGNYPENRIFAAKFLDDFNGRDSDNTVVVGTNINNPIIQHNRLYLDGATGNGIKYTIAEFQNFVNKGTVVLKFIPLYTGIPSQTQTLFEAKNIADNYNRVTVAHYTNGALYFFVFTETGSQQTAYINFSATANKEYIIEANFDLEAGKLRLFLDGLMTEVNISQNLVRKALPDFSIGTNSNGTQVGYGYIRDVAIFSDVVHTQDYIDEISLFSRNYAEYFEFTGARLNRNDSYKLLINYKDNNIDADYFNEIENTNTTPTIIGSPFVTDGLLYVKGNSQVDYNIGYNTAMSELTIRLGYEPLYDNIPAIGQPIFKIHNGINNKSQIDLAHSSTGYFIFHATDASGVNTLTLTHEWTVSKYSVYNIEINLNFITREVKIFIEGSLFLNSYLPEGWFRDLSTSILSFGNSAYDCNIGIRYFQIIDRYIHSSDYTDYNKMQELVYPIQEAYYIEPKTKILTDGLENVGGDVIDTADGERRYIVVRDNDLLYWDGSQWTESDGTWAQANDPVTMITNLSSLDLTAGYNCTFRVLLRSETGIDTDEIQSIVIDYNFYGGDASDLDTCTVYGYVYDFNNQPLSNADIYIKLIDDATEGKKIFPDKYTIKTTTNSNGYFEIDLVPNSSISPTSGYQFSIEKYNFSLKVNKVVPNSTSANFNDMTIYS